MIITSAMILYETTTYRARFLRDATALSDLYSLTLSAALHFNDPKAARENLSTLSTRREIRMACVYRIDGSVIAQYVRQRADKGPCPQLIANVKGHTYNKTYLKFYFPIVYSREHIGMLFLKYDLTTLFQRFVDYGIILVVVSLTLIMVSALILLGLKKYVSTPLLKLAQTAHLISSKQEYKHRAVVYGNDEMGGLTKAFNQMLDTIELSLSLNQATLEATADGILVVNQNGEMKNLNQQFIDLWHIPQSVLESRSDDHLINFVLNQLKHPDDFSAKIAEIYSHPEIESFDILEFKDGRIFERNSRPQRIDQKIVGRVWSFRDVTIRKRTEQSLRQSESRFRRVSDSNMIGIIFCDLDGSIFEANDYFLRMVGYSRYEMCSGKLKWNELTPPEFYELDEAAIQEVKERGVITTYEKEFIHKNGKRVPLLLGGALLEGSSTKIVAYFLDISVRKQAERERDKSLIQEREARLEAENALRLREDFISIAAHELRTPLTPLKIQNDALRRLIQKNPGVAQLDSLMTFVKISDRQIHDLTRLVDDLLDFNRIRTGRLTLRREKFDLSTLVAHVVEQFKDSFLKNRIKLSLNIAPDVVGTWDRLRIEQVVNNLFTNAIKYGPGMPLMITVSKNQETASLIVQDFGIGIKEKDQERIFNRFERASSVDHYGGFGLGLYISREIVEGHHGHIFVESGKGEGTKFIVDLPLHNENDKFISL